MAKKKKKPVIHELNLSQPDYVADIYLASEHMNGDELYQLRRINERWKKWDGMCYEACPDEFFRGKLRYWMLQHDLVKLNRKGELVYTNCNIRAVSELIDGIIAKVILSSDKASFFWINEGKSYAKAESIISFENGLLSLENYKLYKHTPNWFITSVLPFKYKKKEGCPNWKEWLKKTSGNDKNWIRCLQLWFGYNLIPDTSRQKFAHFFGLPRTGKGTAARILGSILGGCNCTSPTLTQLGDKNAFASLVGKLAAFVSDAVIGRNVDSKVVMETLSAVIGEDPVNINEKYQPTVSSVKLQTRFTIISNEALKWPDPTNKLSRRCLVFPFPFSFAGHENPEIERGLMDELPGITNWAIEGLKRLRAGAKLEEPKAGKEKHELFRDLDSPINVFCKYCLIATDEIGSSGKMLSVNWEDVRCVWNVWCREENRSTKGQTRTYVRSLIQNHFPMVKIKRRGKRGDQKLHYVGLQFTKEGSKLLKKAMKKRRTVGAFKASILS